jgi:hypothetical protein
MTRFDMVSMCAVVQFVRFVILQCSVWRLKPHFRDVKFALRRPIEEIHSLLKQDYAVSICR